MHHCHKITKTSVRPKTWHRQHTQHAKVQDILHHQRVQFKLTIGETHDGYEQEADRVAAAVLSSNDHSSRNHQIPSATAYHPNIPQKGLQSRSQAQLESRLNHLKQGGAPLTAAERDFFEPRFGVDFGSVRLHSGKQAAELAAGVGARAFTLGPHIVFGQGEYAPGSDSGRALLAHELTHTVQQQAAHDLGTGQNRSHTDSNVQHGITQHNATGRLQRLALTNGQFGRALQRYQRDVGVPDRPFRLIRRSSQFMNLVRVLDRHYVNLYEPSLPTYYETGVDGRLINDRGANGRWAGSNRRVIHIWSSGVDESSSFDPASRSTYPYDVMWLHDIFYYTQLPPTDQLTQDGTFIEALAHETTHAHNLVTGSGRGAGPNATLAASIAASVTEEIQTRQQEARILGQVQRRGGLRGYRPSTGSTLPREVQRSFVSGTPRRTYLEMFFFANKLQTTGNSLSDERASSLEQIVRGIPLTSANADRFLDKNEPIFFFDSSVGLYDVLSEEYAKWLFWQRVIDKRWEAFRSGSNQSDALKERILQRHARAYFDSGVNYLP